MYKGIPASAGFAIGKAFVLAKDEQVITADKAENTQEALETLQLSLDKAAVQINGLCEKTKLNMGEEEAQVFESHLMMLEDPEYIGLIKKHIEKDGFQVAYAVQKATDHFVSFFESMQSEYMKARAADIQDVSRRIIQIALGQEMNHMVFDEDVVLIADDLTPSDTAQLDKNRVKAFVTQVGSKTSHSAIMARSMGIPAVLGVANACEGIAHGTMVIVDGMTGEIHQNPSQDLYDTYEAKIKELSAYKEKLKAYKEMELAYADGRPIAVAGNIGSVADLDQLCNQGAQGIGLFRTEFLFMGRQEMPTEEEQFEAYKIVADRMSPHAVVIRTLDIGGDKVIPYMHMPKEDNPFLGLRALRLCLTEIEIFKTQLKALLRAGLYGNVHIMFPMVGALKELADAKKVVQDCKDELRAAGIPFKEDLPIGIMIEIPSAAIIADDFAKEVDFLSIGTNDLVQYTLAVDRMNPAVAHLYDPFHPAVLSLIKRTIDAAHNHGIWCGMCGEMASTIEALPILTAYGLDEFSVTGSMVLEVKAMLSKQHGVQTVRS